MLLRAVLLSLALSWPLAQASAAVDPAPIFSREPAFSEKVRQLVADAEKSLRTGNKQEALQKLSLAASLEPNNPYVTARLAVVLNMTGNYQAALDRLQRARKLGAPNDVVLPPMLEAMISMGHNQNLLDLFPDPGASTSYTSGLILRARASALQVMGDRAGANTAMKRSLAILNDYSGVMTAARIALMQGDYDAADKQADAALKLRPRDIEARMLKIALVLQRRDFVRARQMADTLVADNPNSASALLMRIKTYVVSDRSDMVEPEWTGSCPTLPT
jgi:Flp pilus assembly protein TadD